MAKASADATAGSPLVFNEPHVSTLNVTVPKNQPVSQPYWLREPKQGETYTVSNQLDIGLPENPPLLRAHFHLHVDDADIEVTRPVMFRYIERSEGERTRPLIVEPEVALQLSEGARVFPNGAARSIHLQVEANVPDATGHVQIQVPADWAVEPREQDFKLSSAGQDDAGVLRGLRRRPTIPRGLWRPAPMWARAK